MSGTPDSTVNRAEARGLETTTKENVFYTNDKSSSPNQSTIPSPGTIEYTSETPFRGFFIYGAIVGAGSPTSQLGSIRVLKRDQDSNNWNLMPKSCPASRGDIQAACFTKDELADLAKICAVGFTFDDADFNRTTKVTGTYNFSSATEAGFVILAWRFHGDPHHVWFDGKGFLIKDLTAFPAESLNMDN
ncbi:hypothetical protein NW768_008362 [Fusarium equiseti]|uniref:Uncharacterized protein n=1 Tax=Fusarium equiseti TaxID=61235 RepID=A0ABQ8R6S5_FUSEQ|nr:hypothetical protein NW768_008362 [Fusarium equiseti]